ncbi:hypothetical protein POM88_044084 [Heracleum sosnowskyi]|uniref:Uncharacterized protein n=1 Tax=Heracleum sosnowskyi TaxID=360622 RepID=A0AAD8M2K1_9APIA|nr:hypothetical protein POM88_044084 [Heracleum sosnowskyi]
MCVHLVTRAFTNCSDAVRSLAVMPGSRFVSASDDGLWTLDGKLESTMVGHTFIVYSVDGNVSGVLLSVVARIVLQKYGEDVHSIKTNYNIISFEKATWFPMIKRRLQLHNQS